MTEHLKTDSSEFPFEQKNKSHINQFGFSSQTPRKQSSPEWWYFGGFWFLVSLFWFGGAEQKLFACFKWKAETIFYIFSSDAGLRLN